MAAELHVIPNDLYQTQVGLLSKKIVDDVLEDPSKAPLLIDHALRQWRPHLQNKLEQERDPRDVAYLQGSLRVIREMLTLEESLFQMKKQKLLDAPR